VTPHPPPKFGALELEEAIDVPEPLGFVLNRLPDNICQHHLIGGQGSYPFITKAHA
jgi:hypothetical protein